MVSIVNCMIVDQLAGNPCSKRKEKKERKRERKEKSRREGDIEQHKTQRDSVTPMTYILEQRILSWNCDAKWPNSTLTCLA